MVSASRGGVMLTLALLLALGFSWTRQARAGDCPELLRHTFPSLQKGELQDLCQYRDKVVLVVNTASYCGFTNQYDGLETLYRKYKDRGLVVLGFPSNDFGGQEPGDSKQIANFCRLTYSVEFPMFQKSRVSGNQRNAFYAELARRTGKAPEWNFHKYLIDRGGARVLSFDSAVPPEDKHLLQELGKMLDARAALGGGPVIRLGTRDRGTP
jgi:glutathione peroxidase